MDRSGKHRTVVPVMVPKDTSWQDQIVDMCVDSLQTGVIPRPKVDQEEIYIRFINFLFKFPMESLASKRAPNFSKVSFFVPTIASIFIVFVNLGRCNFQTRIENEEKKKLNLITDPFLTAVT